MSCFLFWTTLSWDWLTLRPKCPPNVMTPVISKLVKEPGKLLSKQLYTGTSEQRVESLGTKGPSRLCHHALWDLGQVRSFLCVLFLHGKLNKTILNHSVSKCVTKIHLDNWLKILKVWFSGRKGVVERHSLKGRLKKKAIWPSTYNLIISIQCSCFETKCKGRVLHWALCGAYKSYNQVNPANCSLRPFPMPIPVVFLKF